MPSPRLTELIVERSQDLDRLVRRYAGALLTRETIEDLAQTVRLKLLESEATFEWRGDAAFHSWLETVVRNELNARRTYWNAARRAAGHLLRITSNPGMTGGGIQPRADATGPVSFAERRDQVDLAVRAIETLLPRDQEILEMERAGASIADIASKLALSEAAAGKARQRALERFRRAFELISG